LISWFGTWCEGAFDSGPEAEGWDVPFPGKFHQASQRSPVGSPSLPTGDFVASLLTQLCGRRLLQASQGKPP
jgi:hypothetical protein